MRTAPRVNDRQLAKLVQARQTSHPSEPLEDAVKGLARLLLATSGEALAAALVDGGYVSTLPQARQVARRCGTSRPLLRQ